MCSATYRKEVEIKPLYYSAASWMLTCGNRDQFVICYLKKKKNTFETSQFSVSGCNFLVQADSDGHGSSSFSQEFC